MASHHCHSDGNTCATPTCRVPHSANASAATSPCVRVCAGRQSEKVTRPTLQRKRRHGYPRGAAFSMRDSNSIRDTGPRPQPQQHATRQKKIHCGQGTARPVAQPRAGGGMERDVAQAERQVFFASGTGPCAARSAWVTRFTRCLARRFQLHRCRMYLGSGRNAPIAPA